MYREFLEAVLAYITALNEACAKVDESAGLAPYVDSVPVIMEDEICGFIRDEIGGSFSYHPATTEEREWWDQRPWKPGKANAHGSGQEKD